MSYQKNTLIQYPGLMAAYYMGKPISRDLSEEKAIIEQAQANA